MLYELVHIRRGLRGDQASRMSYRGLVWIRFQITSHNHGARAVPLALWILNLPTAGNRYHALFAFSAAVSLAMLTMPNRPVAGNRSDTFTAVARGVAMKLIVVISSSAWGGSVRIYRRSKSSDCRANGGRRMWMKATKGEVVYATKTNGIKAKRAAIMCK
jgi:hypothetical protein